MILRKRPQETNEPELRRLIRQELGDADDDTLDVVEAVVGLLASVAYADSVFTEEEKKTVRTELGRIQLLDTKTVDAICKLLEEDIQGCVAAGDQRWARYIKQSFDYQARLDVLDALLEIAASGGELAITEANYLRRLAPMIGLSQDDYNQLQSRHREKLKVLKES